MIKKEKLNIAQSHLNACTSVIPSPLASILVTMQQLVKVTDAIQVVVALRFSFL